MSGFGFVVTKKPGEAPVIKAVKAGEVGYEMIKEAVEGYIECVHVGEGHRKDMTIDMWVNEEGKLNGMKPNLMFPSDVIVGPVLFCYGTRSGKSVPFPEEYMAVQVVMQIMSWNIEDPDSVEVPEPSITITDWEGNPL